MEKSSKHFESWVNEYLQPNHPGLVQPFLNAVKIYQNALSTNVLPNDALSMLMMYIHDPHKALSENVATMLGELADHFENARNDIRTLLTDSHRHVRINALVALHSHNLSPLHEELLKTALSDRSAEVRILAADKALIFGLQQLRPELDIAIQREKNPRTKQSLEWYRDHLQQQYTV